MEDNPCSMNPNNPEPNNAMMNTNNSPTYIKDNEVNNH